jgi:hypothetical protein
MYNLNDLLKAVDEPREIIIELCRLYYTRLRTQSYNYDGIDIFAEEWDNLLLLDACRYDMFKRNHNLPGHLSSRQSRGSSTPEFLRGNVAGRDLTDVVYITANPQYQRNISEFEAEFHFVDNVWASQGWDDEFRTVRPEVVTDAAKDAAIRFPKKRLLVHYIQPHYPFIGELGRELMPGQNLNLWTEVSNQRINIGDPKLWEAFEENLTVALPAVRELMKALSGRTVVSSDHGQLMGERLYPIPVRHYGHPSKIYLPELVKVPWLVQEGTRREITKESSIHNEADVQTSHVRERLEDLGYTET